MRAQKRNLLVMKFDQNFYTELKKVYFMGSEIQPGFIFHLFFPNKKNQLSKKIIIDFTSGMSAKRDSILRR
jgi:hypothetical protein